MQKKASLKQEITTYAKALGFDLIGFADINPPKISLKIYQNWLVKKYAGKMQYLKKISPRKDLRKILKNASTVICLAVNYYHEQPEKIPKNKGVIARYAFGRDYHKIISQKLKKLEKFIREKNPKAEMKSYVDTGPILERSFAVAAGLGNLGKNSCLITREYGSYVFLAEIITTLPLISRRSSSPSPLTASNFPACGTCRKCLDACPTKAIIAPGVIDARKCISYLTIENKGKIPQKFHAAIKKSQRLFGCDICQEACPHNCRATETAHQEFLTPMIAGNSIPLNEIIKIKSDTDYLEAFAGSPLMRAKRKGLIRNAKVLLR